MPKQASYSTASGHASRLMRSALSFGLLAALRFGPAGVAGWALKSVSRRPLKFLIAVALEPALARLARRLQNRFNIH
ncbi:hypothetical protein TUM12370_17420 [Salmonella enterica subsp. enterica serovar Choleraesuis]|nr:hypothetical protein TUM12370_17420 [Salmonella enterica subsp. enterica serovar Choleraesuis]